MIEVTLHLATVDADSVTFSASDKTQLKFGLYVLTIPRHLWEDSFAPLSVKADLSVPEGKR